MRLIPSLLAATTLAAGAFPAAALEGARLKFTHVLIGHAGKHYPGFGSVEVLPTGQMRVTVQSCDDDTAPNKWKTRYIAVLSTPGAAAKADTYSCASTKDDGRVERSSFEITSRSTRSGDTWDFSYLSRQDDDDGRGDRTYRERRYDIVLSYDGKRCAVSRFSDVRSQASQYTKGQMEQDTDRYDIAGSRCTVERL